MAMHLKRRDKRQVPSPWGRDYWRHWEKVDNLAYDLLVCPTADGLWLELVGRYNRHPLVCWRECLSDSRWMTNYEVFTVGKSRLKEALEKAKAAGVGKPALDTDFGEQFPIIYALMTEVQIDAKTTRQPSSITIFTQDGLWKCCIVEKDTDKSLFGSADTFLGALANVEARLDAPIVDWRERAPRGKKGK